MDVSQRQTLFDDAHGNAKGVRDLLDGLTFRLHRLEGAHFFNGAERRPVEVLHQGHFQDISGVVVPQDDVNAFLGDRFREAVFSGQEIEGSKTAPTGRHAKHRLLAALHLAHERRLKQAFGCDHIRQLAHIFFSIIARANVLRIFHQAGERRFDHGELVGHGSFLHFAKIGKNPFPSFLFLDQGPRRRMRHVVGLERYPWAARGLDAGGQGVRFIQVIPHALRNIHVLAHLNRKIPDVS